MGLESHITRTLQREKSGFVEGEDYWFEFGLTTGSVKTAFEIRDILDASGEFGPAKVKRVSTPDYITSRKETFKIEFGTHPQFVRT